MAGGPGGSRAGDDAGGRTGFHQVGGLAPGRPHPHHAPVGEHDAHRAGDAARGEADLQRCHVARHHRADIGVDDGGAGPFVLADLRQDLRRRADEDLRGQGLAQRCDDAGLVRGIGVAVQQRDRHAFDPGLGDLRDDAGEIRRIEWFPLRPARPEAAGDLEAQAPHLQHVAKAPPRHGRS